MLNGPCILQYGNNYPTDTTEYILFKAVANRIYFIQICQLLNMFRVVFHLSSEAHNTVSTVSGINETCTANCRERGWAGTGVKVSLMPDTVHTVL